MTTVRDIYHLLDEKAPFALQESWDNSGMLLGHWTQPVKHVLVALDITPETAQEAAELGCQLMVSHHPVLFNPAKHLTDDPMDNVGQTVLKLAEQKIAAVCCHTNLDAAHGGVNYVLARKCGLDELRPLEQIGLDALGRPYGIGRVGELRQEMTLDVYLDLLKEGLKPNGLRYVSGGKPVHRVAVGGGACGSMMETAVKAGCDTFVTADLKYNHFLDARDMGLNLIDAGHFPTENPVTDLLCDWLRSAFPAVKVTKSARHHEVISYR